MLDFFRRPQLAGNNLNRIPFAVVHGELRRTDADGTSAIPYFTGVSSGQTLNFSIDGTPYSVTLTGNSLAGVLSDINTAIGIHGTAFDSDGSISIQTTTPGGLGSVSVTGGTASALLGFNTTRDPIFSTGGDIPVSPEGRLGNWQDVAFPNRRSNLTSDVLNNAMARLSANQDVLYSESIRSSGRLLRISSGLTISADRQSIALPSSFRLYTGLGKLSRITQPLELSEFFQVYENSELSHQPAAQQVKYVQIGTVSNFSNTDAPNLSGSGNILGLDLVKASNAITTIAHGKFVQCSGANFTSAGVVPGDTVQISGSTNVSPFSNEGYRWIVEAVTASDTLALRPMSLSELTMVGTTLTNNQPVVELNGKLVGSQAYGTLVVKTGSFCSGVKLVLDQPLPFGSIPEVFVAGASDSRHKTLYEETEASGVWARTTGFPVQPIAGTYISGLDATSSTATSIELFNGYMRWKGRALYVPDTGQLDFSTIVPGISSGTIHYFYVGFNYDTGSYVFNNSAGGTPSSITDGGDSQVEILYRVNLDISFNFVSFTDLRRREAADSRPITVGRGGQFSTLESAIDFMSVHNHTEFTPFVQSRANSTNPHAEIVILNDLTVGPFTSALPGLTIRGANPLVALTFTGSISVSASFKMENLIVIWNDSTTDDSLINVVTPTNVELPFTVSLKNLFHLPSTTFGGSTGTMGHVVGGVNSTTAGGLLDTLIIENCNFTPTIGVVYSGGTVGGAGKAPDSIILHRNVFTQALGSATSSIIHSTSAINSGSSYVSIRDNQFLLWGTAVGGSGFSGSILLFNSNSTAKINIYRNTFSFAAGLLPGADASYIITAQSPLTKVSENVCDGPIPGFASILSSGVGIGSVTNNYLNFGSSGVTFGVNAGVVSGNQVTASVGSSQMQTALCAWQLASGNYLAGAYAVGIKAATSFVPVTGNFVRNLSPLLSCTCIQSTGSSNVSGNFVIIAKTGDIGIDVSASSPAASVSANTIVCGVFLNTTAIKVGASGTYSITGNTFATNANTTDIQGPSSGATNTLNMSGNYCFGGFGIAGNFFAASVMGNYFNGTVTPTITGTASVFSGNIFFKTVSVINSAVTGNQFLNNSGQSNAFTTCTVSNNIFLGFSITVFTACSVTGNGFAGTGAVTITSPSAGADNTFCNNTVDSTGTIAVSWGTANSQNLNISGNRFAGTFVALNAGGSTNHFGNLFINNNNFGPLGVSIQGFDALEFTGNRVLSDATISPTSNTASTGGGSRVEISSNFFSGTLTSLGNGDAQCNHNSFGSSSSLTTVSGYNSGTSGRIEFSHNIFFGGGWDVDGDYVVMYGNVGSVGSFYEVYARAVSSLVYNGNVSPYYTVLDGKKIEASGNRCVGGTNYIDARCTNLNYTNNYVDASSTGNSPALAIFGVDQSSVVTTDQSYVIANNTLIVSAVLNGAFGIPCIIKFGTSPGFSTSGGVLEIFRNVHIHNNVFRALNGLGGTGSYSGSTFAAIYVDCGWTDSTAGGMQRAQIVSNSFELPGNPNHSTNTSHVYTFRAQNNTAVAGLYFQHNLVFNTVPATGPNIVNDTPLSTEALMNGGNLNVFSVTTGPSYGEVLS